MEVTYNYSQLLPRDVRLVRQDGMNPGVRESGKGSMIPHNESVCEMLAVDRKGVSPPRIFLTSVRPGNNS
jgi:hypothetical protein